MKKMRVHVFRLELDETPTKRDYKLIEAMMRMTEKKLSNGQCPSFHMGVVNARKIARTID